MGFALVLFRLKKLPLTIRKKARSAGPEAKCRKRSGVRIKGAELADLQKTSPGVTAETDFVGEQEQTGKQCNCQGAGRSLPYRRFLWVFVFRSFVFNEQVVQCIIFIFGSQV